MTDAYRLVIGGERVDAASGETFDSIDPSTGEAFAAVAKAGQEDVRRAVQAARTAFDEGPWPRLRGRERATAMLKVADLVKARGKELAELEARDSGGTIRKAQNADVGMVISTFRTYAEMAAREDDEEPLSHGPASLNYLRREPIGVCAAISPWNFPIQMAAWKIAPAIAAGNAVVLKPASFTPLTSLELGAICAEAGVPEGVVSVLSGPGAAAGEALVESPQVDKVAFTGSTEVGRRIMQLASGSIKKCTLELGGKSPAIVLDDAPLDYAVDGVLWGVFFHQGQVCSAGTRAFVHHAILDDFVAELVKRAEAIRVGPALDPASDIGPVVAKSQLETVERYVETGREEGAELLTGGERAAVEGHDGGFYYRPTIFAGTNDLSIAQEEIFGPVLVVIPVEDDDEAVRLANRSIYGLAGAVWSGSNPRAIEVAEGLRTGTVWINDYHMINPRFPFGGYKESGLGREHGRLGFDEYRETKHVHVDLLGPDRTRHPWWDITVPKRGG
ncbi:MAG TPA: aldehyde dehydrogenase family protein [Actinomycetota bacterium]|nr:aldehyde dehydrogenase family protein [Actinomycetota bacterium]